MNTQAALLLLADSQLLFRPENVPQVARHFSGRPVSAAYIGAANGNVPDFFELACSALDTLFQQTVACAFVRTPQELKQALPNLLILSGGHVAVGWAFLQQPAVRDMLQTVLENPDALVIGVSAGAIHLARGCDPEQDAPVAHMFLDAYPHFIAVHEEQHQWPSRQVWQSSGRAGDFVGIPLGGGLWVQPQGCEAVGKGLTRF